jgi:hypothetical protein
MPKSTKGASAPSFLVISDSPRATTYTGTRDQLIALGVACPDHFPEGRKRVKWKITPVPASSVDDFNIRKLKGDRFELLKWHKPHPPKIGHSFIVTTDETKQGGYAWRLLNSNLSGLSKDSRAALDSTLKVVKGVVEWELLQTRRSRLKLVNSGSVNR